MNPSFLSSKNKILFYNISNDHGKGEGMKEKDLAKQIKDRINEDVPLEIFVNLWFRGKKFRDDQMTNKLLEFSKKNNLDYLIVISKPRRVRFWKLKDVGLLNNGGTNNG